MPRKTITAGLKPEHDLIADGYRHVVGIDEAGRGAWAGPVFAGAVMLPLDRPDLSELLAGVRDSKQMTAHSRTVLCEAIKLYALAWGVGSAAHDEIDAIGIVPATCRAMKRALDQAISRAPVPPDFLLLDSIRCTDLSTWGAPYTTMIKGDRLSLSIAAASVIAKVSRDAHMRDMHTLYPAYAFNIHKGYGTAKHRDAIAEHGPCAIHRMSFAPLRPSPEHVPASEDSHEAH